MKLRTLFCAIAALALVAATSMADSVDPVLMLGPESAVTPDLPSVVPTGEGKTTPASVVSANRDSHEGLGPSFSPFIASQGSASIRHRSRRDEPPPVAAA